MRIFNWGSLPNKDGEASSIWLFSMSRTSSIVQFANNLQTGFHSSLPSLSGIHLSMYVEWVLESFFLLVAGWTNNQWSFLDIRQISTQMIGRKVEDEQRTQVANQRWNFSYHYVVRDLVIIDGWRWDWEWPFHLVIFKI